MYNALFLSYDFPPLGSFEGERIAQLVKYLPEYNWNSTVLCGNPTFSYQFDPSFRSALQEKNVKVIGVPENENMPAAYDRIKSVQHEVVRKFSRFCAHVFHIPDEKTTWAKEAYKKAVEIINKETFDLIFVSGPPFSSFWAAAKLHLEFDIPLVLDYRDLWFGGEFETYVSPLHKLRANRLEYSILRKADLILVSNRRIKEKLMDFYKFLNHDNIVIFPYGYDPKEIDAAFVEPRKHDRFVISFFGFFRDFISPRSFLKAFKLVAQRRPDIASNIDLKFIGFLRPQNMRYVKSLELQDFVSDYGFLNHHDLLNKMASTDLVWAAVGSLPNSDTVLQPKLFEAFGFGKPILAAVPQGAQRQLLVEYKSSYLSEPDDIEAIYKNILTAYQDFRLGAAPQPNKEFVEKYRTDFLTEQLTKEMQFLTRVSQ